MFDPPRGVDGLEETSPSSEGMCFSSAAAASFMLLFISASSRAARPRMTRIGTPAADKYAARRVAAASASCINDDAMNTSWSLRRASIGAANKGIGGASAAPTPDGEAAAAETEALSCGEEASGEGGDAKGPLRAASVVVPLAAAESCGGEMEGTMTVVAACPRGVVTAAAFPFPPPA